MIKDTRCHRQAFSLAFKEVYGIDASIDIIEFYGMTQIIKEVLRKSGLDDKIIDEKLPDCMRSMLDAFETLVNSGSIRIQEGASDLVFELASLGVLTGLVTGNLELIAKKMEKKCPFLLG